MTSSPAPSLCWIVVNLVHYHDARIRAFAEKSLLQTHVVAICDDDTFGTLRCAPADAPYQRHTLLPGTRWEGVDRKKMFRRLFKVLDELRPAVVCVNGWSFGGALAAFSWCAARHVPAILMTESCEHDEPRVWWKEAIKRRIVGMASTALAGGTRHARYLERLGFPPDRIFLGYDVVDNAHFSRGADAARADAPALRRQLNLPERYFVASSRFTPKKNLSQLIKGYARYRKDAPGDPWHLVILGDGPLRQELHDQRAAEGLEDLVQIPGAQGYDMMPVYYGLAGAFVHVSTAEQWGLVVNEAMAAGLPVVVSDRCGCAPDLVKPGLNGLLVNPRSEESIAAALAAMAEAPDEEREAASRASRDLIAAWSPEAFAEGLVAAADLALADDRVAPTAVDRAILYSLRLR